MNSYYKLIVGLCTALFIATAVLAMMPSSKSEPQKPPKAPSDVRLYPVP